MEGWKEGDAVPPGFHVLEKRRRWLFLTGLIPFSVVYGGSLLLGVVAAAVGNNKEAAGIFCIPFAGPFIDLGTQPMTKAEMAAVAIDGVLQILSGAALVTSLVLPQKKLVPGFAGFRMAPALAPGMAGVVTQGAF